MATNRLTIYNQALHLIGERLLLSEYENAYTRTVLDEAWKLDPASHCLELVKPRFAVATAKLSSPVVSAAHSLDQVYTLPTDYLTLVELYADEDLQTRVDRYLIEGRTVATEVATNLYARYVSSTLNYAMWTPGFAQLVGAYLATKIATRIAPDKKERVEQDFKDMLAAAMEVESAIEPRARPLKPTRTLDAHWIRVYNLALQALGQPLVVSNADQTAARVALDYAVGTNKENVYFLLEQLRPVFALKTAALAGGNPSGVHGYTEVHALPADYLCLVGLYSDNKLDQPVGRYLIDGTNLNTTFDPVYLRYVQNAPTDASWSPGFLRFVGAYLAGEISAQFAAGESGSEREARRQTIQRQIQEYRDYVLQNEAWKEPPQRAQAASHTLTDSWRVVYNKALSILRLPPILSNGDDSQRRAALDQTVVDEIVATVLEQIPWVFSSVRAELDFDTGQDAAFGPRYRFTLPGAVHRVVAVYTDDRFIVPAEYVLEGGYLWSSSSKVYLRYVSTAMLTTPENWPVYFTNLVAAEMAALCGWLPNADLSQVEMFRKRYFDEATHTDTTKQSNPVIRAGTWTRARFGEPTGRIEGGRYTNN